MRDVKAQHAACASNRDRETGPRIAFSGRLEWQSGEGSMLCVAIARLCTRLVLLSGISWTYVGPILTCVVVRLFVAAGILLYLRYHSGWTVYMVFFNRGT